MKSLTNKMMFKVWFHFGILTVSILLIMWLLQIAFLEKYYEQYKYSEINTVSNNIIGAVRKDGISISQKSLSEYIGQGLMCVEVYNDQAESLLQYDNLGNSYCVLHDLSPYSVSQYMSSTNRSNSGSFSLKFVNPTTIQGMYVYIQTIDYDNQKYYIFINAPLEMLDSTVAVLRKQFSILAILVFIIATFISFILSRRLVYPISNITKSAKKLAKGEFDISFEGEGYEEIVELSNTLNYATDEFQKTDELRRDLVANVSHDIKTPLTMIKAYTEMIQDLSGENPEERQKHLNVILDEVSHLERLVNDMLTLSKYESNVYEINRQRYNLLQHVQKTINLFQGLEIEFVIKVDPYIEVMADEVKMGQVLFNYINNATRFVGDDKKIFIETEIINKHEVMVKVIDHGPGMSEDEISTIWDRYHKVGKNYYRPQNNSGIGLSIVRAICMAHHSRYGVESTKGKGSTFYYSLEIANNS